MGYRPKIGLTMRLELETRRFYLGRDYSEAVEAAGGVPVHIPLIPDAEFIKHIVGSLDGILLPGSDTDVDPEHYGESPHPKLGRVIPEKDSTDRLVLDQAYARKMPVLAICYGMQALNVFKGGSLVQDIDSQVDEAVKHQQGLPLERNSHGINLGEKGIIPEIASKAGIAKVKVNSHHHQAIRSVGESLTPTSWASDGIIESIEDQSDGRFVLGVQWHPELSWRTDVISRAIFDKFLQSCGREA
ncbi:MAG: gamma-glutamyl-gamma-aminobutyrate hydrolase family protein [Acidobacteria bacterium]|nr:gamma-glutamyl-gamma-aminobutyrate hydrolase family protein [Acidobacteriota bacterium]